MIVDNLKMLYHDLFNFIEKYYKFPKIMFKNKEWKEILAANSQYKNMHQGERCFILGNGPSLKSENLRLLESEFVFSVNQIARHPDFEYIKPNYHFWADKLFFSIDENKPEDMELLNVMNKVNTKDNSPVCFFPIEYLEFTRKFKLNKTLNISYYHSGLIFSDKFKKKIDYTQSVPVFGTVVQWCITMAIYMGFSEIYLLGCDNTSIVTTIKSALNSNDDDDYAYKLTENEKKRMENLLEKQSLEIYLKSYLKNIVEYRCLNDYCKERGIKLVNCSSTTVIDSIPRDSLTNVLKKEK